LDFVKVREAEREQARELFGDDEASMTALAKGIVRKKSASATGGSGAASREDENGVPVGGRVRLSAKERKKVELMIRNAKSLAEIERLERELNEGRIPGGLLVDEDDDDDEDMDE
jgi:U2 small nuclear ribonucleoprotein A'